MRAPSTQPRVMMGNELSPASGSTSPTGPETTRAPCAVASTAVAVNMDHARRFAVSASWRGRPRGQAYFGSHLCPVAVIRANRQSAAHVPDAFGHMRQAPLTRRRHVEASSVIADTCGDAPLVAVKLDDHRPSRGMLGNVLQRLHAAEVQGELHVGRIAPEPTAHELDR